MVTKPQFTITLKDGEREDKTEVFLLNEEQELQRCDSSKPYRTWRGPALVYRQKSISGTCDTHTWVDDPDFWAWFRNVMVEHRDRITIG